MEPEGISRIRSSWETVETHGATLAEAFYRRLFELDPRLKDLFAITEMSSQGEKFLAMMGKLVHLMDDPTQMEELLRDSGRRHEGYGVRPRDYLTVGEAFLWALDHALPEGFDPETRAAWAEGYTRMAFLMQRRSRSGPGPVSTAGEAQE
jgi:hemoglobin-like flavoprotein